VSKGSGRKAATRTERRRNEVVRRRERARRSARLEAKKRRRKLIVRGSAIVLVLLMVGAGLSIFFVHKANEPTVYTLNSPISPTQDGDISVTSPPAAYHITYQVESHADDGSVTTSTEDFTVRRPFDSAAVGKDGAPPGTTQEWAAMSNFGLYSDLSAGSAATISQTGPHTAIGDFRLDSSLSDLITSGMFLPREKRIALDRPCQVYRTGKPLESFTTAQATDTDYTDVCIDASGLMLEEVSVSAGQLAERLTATSVDDQLQATDAMFKINGTPETLAAGGSVLTPIDATKAPVANYWHLDAAPAGYTLKGRYMLREPAATDDTSATTTTTAPGTVPPTNDTYFDVYVNGPKTIIIQQGPKAAQPAGQDAASTIQLGTLGSVQASSNVDGSVLTANPTAPANWFVQVTGTENLATLQQLIKPIHV
jgi:hypothetical protein